MHAAASMPGMLRWMLPWEPRAGWWLALWLMGALPAGAQAVTLTLSNTPSPVKVDSLIQYSLIVSNGRPEQLPPGTVLSAFPASATVVAATNSQGGSITVVEPGLVAFDIPFFTNRAVIQIGLTLRPTLVGQLTNRFTVRTPQTGNALLVLTTNAVTTVAPLEADLAVSILPPPPGVFAGDTFSWRLLAANAGPDTASDVVVTNPLPPGVTFISNGIPVAGTGTVVIPIGTLTNGGTAEAVVHLLATAAGTNALTATIGSANALDPDPANNAFTTNLVILEPDTNALTVSIVSTQMFVAQSGMMEQRIAVSNASAATVESLRVLAGGLTNLLFNAAGTNSGVPFVVHNAALAPGETVELVLEYFNPSRQPGADPLLTAHPSPALDLTPAAGTPVPISRLIAYGEGRILLEFASTNGARYQVLYSTNVASGFIRSQPDVLAGANRVQWTDYGSPRTMSKPADAPARFYQVIQLP